MTEDEKAEAGANENDVWCAANGDENAFMAADDDVGELNGRFDDDDDDDTDDKVDEGCCNAGIKAAWKEIFTLASELGNEKGDLNLSDDDDEVDINDDDDDDDDDV